MIDQTVLPLIQEYKQKIAELYGTSLLLSDENDGTQRRRLSEISGALKEELSKNAERRIRNQFERYIDKAASLITFSKIQVGKLDSRRKTTCHACGIQIVPGETYFFNGREKRIYMESPVHFCVLCGVLGFYQKLSESDRTRNEAVSRIREGLGLKWH